ncbi:MAG TPA: cytochrome C oxidase subunit IV family protein [Archangium sp.]
MSDAPNSAPAAAHGDGHAHHTNYVKIWGILLVLLVLSVIGPIVGEATHLPVLTLITAFGIAFVKAYLVIKHFMHLTIEKRYIGWLMLTMLAFMLIFVGGVSPDVMKHEGQRWVNTAAQDAVKKGLAEDAANPHGEGH